MYLLQKRKKDNSNVAIAIFYGGSSFLNWYKSICNDKMGIKRITLPPLESEHLERA